VTAGRLVSLCYVGGLVPKRDGHGNAMRDEGSEALDTCLSAVDPVGPAGIGRDVREYPCEGLAGPTVYRYCTLLYINIHQRADRLL